MKSIVVVTGSPRQNGNSNGLASAFISEAENLGLKVTRFDTAEMDIAPCQGCESCIDAKACFMEDDFIEIASALEQADGIVIVSPVYCYTFTAQIKLMLDRCFSLYCAGKLYEGKKCALISCCEEATPSTFTGIKFSFDRTIELMKGQIVGEVLIPGVYKAGDVNNTDGIAQVKALAHKFI